MKLGTTLRVMGPQSTRPLLRAAAELAEEAGLASLWVADHIAIPPDDAEGSGGRYLDPLTSLAYLAGVTQRIALGTGVLVLPYRPGLPTAKAIATLQELSDNRLLLGVGIGWMAAEFRALGRDRSSRGKDSDAMLEFLHRCFADDEVTANGQPFLFKPRPPRPPIYVGGRPPHALERCLRYGDGWFPMRQPPEKLAPHIAALRARADALGRAAPDIVALAGLPLHAPAAALALARDYRAAGVTHLVHGTRYDNRDEFAQQAEMLGQLIDRLAKE